MNKLPDVLQDKIYFDKHALDFHNSLSKIKHIKPYKDFSKADNCNYCLAK